MAIPDDNRCALEGRAADACSDMLASFHAAKIMRSQAKQNLQFNADGLRESICRWEDMNFDYCTASVNSRVRIFRLLKNGLVSQSAILELE
ncbi:hypothetical protein [Microcoleus sp. D2_18a_D3]|uniref:hypothetical protein n=1 Tax=Microcoleus sp. D2_18a_D3 TaxID=3055330 RepID=UPI002FD50E34